MSKNSLILVLQKKQENSINDMAKVQIKSEKLTPFGGIFSIMELFDALLSQTIDSPLGLRCKLYGYQYSEIFRSLRTGIRTHPDCHRQTARLLQANSVTALGRQSVLAPQKLLYRKTDSIFNLTPHGYTHKLLIERYLDLVRCEHRHLTHTSLHLTHIW